MICAAFIAGCANLKTMEKAMQSMGMKSNPDPLEVHGDTVSIAITGKFPAKSFPKKASIELFLCSFMVVKRLASKQPITKANKQ